MTILRRTPSASRRLAVAGLVIAAALGIAGRAGAQTINWNNAAGGIWGTSGNWNPTNVPGSTNNASFSLNSTYTVTANATLPVFNDWNITAGTITFNSSGGRRTYSVTGGSAPRTLSVLGSANVSLGSTGNPIDVVVGGVFNVGQGATVGLQAGSTGSFSAANIGTLTGSSGTVNVSGTGTNLTASQATLGGGGATGTLVFSTGAAGTLGAVLLSEPSSANDKGFLQVLSDADVTVSGNLDVSNGSGVLTGIQGQVTVDGTGSTITQSGNTTITLGSSGAGFLGTGKLLIGTTASGGTLTTGTGQIAINRTGEITVGTTGGLTGTLNASGNLAIDGGLLRANSGSVLSIAAGKSVTITNGGSFLTPTLGYLLDGTTWSATGAGSSFSAKNILVSTTGMTSNLNFAGGATGTIVDLRVAEGAGAAAQGFVAISGGSSLTASGVVGLNDSSGIAASVNGQISINDPSSSFTQTGSSAFNVGNTAAGTGKVLVSTTTSGASLSTGTGTLTVATLGSVQVGSASATGTFNANGNIVVDGGALTVFANSSFSHAAGKNLTVSHGGDFLVVAAVPLTLSSGATYTVDGTPGGSNNSSTLFTAGGLVSVGSAGTSGVLNLSNQASGSVGALSIADSAAGGAMGQLNVLTGATLSIGGDFNLAHLDAARTTATAVVRGTGSQLSQTGAGNVNIGVTDNVNASLTIDQGGFFSTGTGQITILQGGKIDVGSAITDGGFRANGDLLIQNGSLLFEAGTTNGSFQHALGKSLTIDGSAVVFRQNDLTVGAGGTYSADGFDSTLSSQGVVSVGSGSGVGTLNLSDRATANFSGDLIVVNAANPNVKGFVNVTSNAGLTLSGNLSIGLNSASGQMGQVSVDGSGSTITQTGDVQIIVGSSDPAATGVAKLLVAPTAAGATFSSGAGQITVLRTGEIAVGSSAGGLGTFTANGTTTLDGGKLTVFGGSTFNGPQGLVVQNGGLLTINGGTVNLASFAVADGPTNVAFNSGSLIYSGNLTIGPGGFLGSSVNLAADRSLTLTGTTTISPFQSLTLSGGSLTTASLVNNGTFSFNAGRLNLTGSGGLTVGAGQPLGARLTLTDATSLAVTNALTVSANSSVTLSGGAFTAGSLVLSGNLDITSGGLTVNGALTNNATGALTLRGGVGTGASLSNSGAVTVDVGTMNFSSTVTNNSGGRIFVGTTGTLVPTAGITNAAGARIELLGGAARVVSSSQITNNGLITGDGEITAPVQNNGGGEIRAELNKTLVLSGANPGNSGTLNLTGGTLEFTQPQTNFVSGSISGQGILVFGGTGLNNGGQMQFSGDSSIFGDVAMVAGSRVINSGGNNDVTFYGKFVHNGTEVRTSATNTTVFFGAVSGAGPFTGPGAVRFEGTYSPGNSPAAVTFDGNLALGPEADLVIELAGPTPGSLYDQLFVTGALTLDGDFELRLLGGYVPVAGQQFQVFAAGSVTGAFDTTTLPLNPNLWNVTNLTSDGFIVFIPEPSAWMLLNFTVAAVGALLRPRRSRRHREQKQSVAHGRGHGRTLQP